MMITRGHLSQLNRFHTYILPRPYQDGFHSETPNHVTLNMAALLATTAKSFL